MQYNFYYLHKCFLENHRGVLNSYENIIMQKVCFTIFMFEIELVDCSTEIYNNLWKMYKKQKSIY